MRGNREIKQILVILMNDFKRNTWCLLIIIAIMIMIIMNHSRNHSRHRKRHHEFMLHTWNINADCSRVAFTNVIRILIVNRAWVEDDWNTVHKTNNSSYIKQKLRTLHSINK